MKTIVLNTDSEIIRDDLKKILRKDLPWKNLCRKKILLTGASGMLASYIAETLLNLPFQLELYALVRNIDKAKFRFSRYLSDSRLHLISADICRDDFSDFPRCNIVIHYASIPRPDKRIPVDVAEPNIVGTWNLLQYARKCPDFEQFLFCSTAGVYGRKGMSAPVAENSPVFLEPLLVESCYPISKAAGENICILFDSQYNIPCKILRYTHTYGPGVDLNIDPRSFASFLANILRSEDIILTSTGEQKRCFCYIADATEAFFRVLLKGERRNAYNIGAPENNISILDLAQLLTGLAPERKIQVKTCQKKNVGGFIPLNTEFVPETEKLKKLGFTTETSIEEGFRRTLRSYIVTPS